MRSATAPDRLEVDALRHGVRLNGLPIDLTAIEFGILAALARDPGVIVNRAALLDLVWGPEFAGQDHLVDLHVADLREKLGDDAERPTMVETVGAFGYRLASIA